MSSFAIIARPRWGGKAIPVEESRGENATIEKALKLFKKDSLNLVAVVDEDMKVVFKQERNCKCRNVQYRMDRGFKKRILICVDCGLEHKMEGVVC